MLFSSDGSAVGDQFLINTYTSSFQQQPAVAKSTAGDFVCGVAKLNSDQSGPSHLALWDPRSTIQFQRHEAQYRASD